MLPLNNLAPAPICEFDAPEKACDACAVLGSIDGGSAVELFAHKGSSVRTCIATMGGTTVGVAEVKGRLCRGDSAKYARLVQLCDAFSIPVVSFVDSEGFLASDEIGGAKKVLSAAAMTYVAAAFAAIAQLLRLIAIFGRRDD
ncbi:MAG: zinc metallopeptidase [Oscillospiraceae bacterium]|nr:zinc metallopeptidase [Oscillospiraceae bacterium]